MPQPQARIISVRHSAYVSHRPPEPKPEAIDTLTTPQEALAILQYVVDSLREAESMYHELSKMLEYKPGEPAFVVQHQRAHQKLNAGISIKKAEIALALGMSERELVHRYLPKTMTGLWFCRPEEPNLRTPVDFLRMAIFEIRKRMETEG